MKGTGGFDCVWNMFFKLFKLKDGDGGSPYKLYHFKEQKAVSRWENWERIFQAGGQSAGVSEMLEEDKQDHKVLPGLGQAACYWEDEGPCDGRCRGDVSPT